MPFIIFFRDHLRYSLGIICGPGIICGTVWGSFAVLGSFADPYSEASVSNDGKIPGFCKFLFLSSVIKFDNEMSEVKTKITIAQLLFMQSQNLLSKTRSTLFITR